MNRWRWAYVLGLTAFAVVPLALPVAELLDPSAWAWSSAERERLAVLTQNTLALAGGTVALALPAGIALAVLLFRTPFAGRRFALFLLALSLFIPLPIVVSSWQATLGARGLLPLELWRDAEGRLFTSGLGTAVWLHALAAVPWVAFIVGIGLWWVEPESEDEAAQVVSPWRVLALVTLPRARASILAAAFFTALQTAGETSVTEMLLVPTLAEEMRTQFATRDAALGRTLLVALPSLLLVWALALGVLSYLESTLAPIVPASRGQRPFAVAPAWTRLGLALTLLALLFLPMGSLIWKLGLSGHPGQWDGTTATHFLGVEARLSGDSLLASLATSLVTGLAAAAFALAGCWLAREHAGFRWLLFGVALWLWVLPGPALGMALKEMFLRLPDGPWKGPLYYGPSPLPLMWAQGLRALPVAVVFLWPTVRMLPRAWFEEARLGGAGPLSEFLHVVAPATWRAVLVSGLACAALCLGEVGASARIETPGWDSISKVLLDRMHTGVDNSVAALCLLMLAAVVATVTAIWIAFGVVRVCTRARQQNRPSNDTASQGA